jgi:hypothetical protein
MRRNLGIVATGLALAFAAGQVFSSTGAQNDPHAEPRQIAERLAASLAEGAHDELRSEMWRCCIDEAVVNPLGDQLALPYKRLCEQIGARTKVELMKAEAAGPSIARFTYAEFHTRGVIIWCFEFIKPHDEWKLHAYSWGPLRMDNGPPGSLLSPLGP